jgi:hypothetical protein
MDIKGLFSAVVGIAVGVVMLPIVITTGRGITHMANGTAIDLPTGVAELIGLLPLIYIVVLISGVAGYIYFSNR